MSDDPKISERYRELPREEPPRVLDDAVLAASRRAAKARPAPLVAPTGRRRWYFPVAAAAVIVLAVAVVAHVEREQPDTEILQPSMEVLKTPPPPPIEQDRRAEALQPARKAAAPSGFAAEPPPRTDSAGALSAPAAAPAPAPASPPPAAQAERKEVGAASAGARPTRDERPRAQSQMTRASVEQSPEVELERIARLRAAGRHEEADKALAEFRKRHPDYRLTDEMRSKVEKK
jgi:hypothetical protein